MRYLAALLALAASVGTPLVSVAAAKPLEVRFYSTDPARTLIGGRYYKPTSGPRPGVVMLHGCSGMRTTSGKLKRRPRFWAEWLVSQGYAVLVADSFTPRGLSSICEIKDRPLTPDTERPFDAYGALKFLQAQPEVQADRIALMGWSNGAMTLLWTIRTGARQRPAGLAHGFRAAVAFYPGCIKLKRRAFTTDVPTLLQLGLADDWTPAGPCLKMVAEARTRGTPITADAYDGAHHGFDNPALPIKRMLTRNSASKTPERHVHVGTDVQARVKAVEKVRDFLAEHLAR